MQTELGRTIVAYEANTTFGWRYAINYDPKTNEVLFEVFDASDNSIMEPLELQEITGWLSAVCKEIKENQKIQENEMKEGAQDGVKN